MKKKVLISGAGVSGIMCALTLDKTLYDIQIIECAGEFRNIGFSIVLWKSGFELLTNVLQKNSEYVEEGRDYHRANSFILFGGNKLHKLKELSSEGFAWVFERAHLMEVLQRALFRSIPKAHIAFSKTIRNFQHSAEGTTVTFSDGTSDTYDFVIIAEGINATSRGLLPIGERVTPSPWFLRYEWFVTETVLRDKAAIFFTRGHLAVIHPPGMRNLLGFYFKKELSEDHQTEIQHAVLAHIKQPDGEDAATDRLSSRSFGLQEVFVDTYCYRRVALIGDAAHGRPPTLGFGTTLAIEDAVEVCAALDNNTLESFSRKRMKRVRSVYRFQNLIHHYSSENRYKVAILTLLTKLFLYDYIAARVKQLASYALPRAMN